MSDRKGLNRQLFWLYEGIGHGPYVFRWTLLVIDAMAVAFFLWMPFQSKTSIFTFIEISFAIFIALDFAGRLYIARPKHRFLLSPFNIADMVVLASLILPMFIGNLAFLRIIRAIRLVRAFTFLRRMRGLSGYLRKHSQIIDRVVNLLVFVMIMTALVYVTQVERNESINSYLDALYFTMASLTTTGYGDIVPEGDFGRFLSIAIMVLGVSLFFRLLQAIVSPQGVAYECPECGLDRHDKDAVHCKHCGVVLHIPTHGAD